MRNRHEDRIPNDDRLMQIARNQEADEEHAIARYNRVKGWEAKHAIFVDEMEQVNQKHLRKGTQ